MSKAKIKLRGISQIHEVDVNPADDTVEQNGMYYSVDKLPLDSLVSGTIYGVLLNYKGAFATLGDAMFEPPYKGEPKAPVLYIKPANTVVGYGMPIPLPADVPELEIGAALGVVIGRTAVRVNEADALEHIAGYTVVNDVSIPHDSVYRPAVSQKCRDGFCPVGPWIIERDAVANADSLDVRVFINGELRQRNTTANLIRNAARLIAEITDFMTLNSGDVLLVGVPEDAPLAQAGDRVRVEINGVGSLENTIVHEHELVMGVTL